MSESILDIKNLSIHYSIREGTVKSVEDVSIDFPKGKNTAIIGESGCGKSTIANSIVGILSPNSIVKDQSQIVFRGKNILKASKEEQRLFRWQKASMVFQAAQNALNPTIKIGEQLLDSIYDHIKISKNDALKKVDELLKLVKLDANRVINSYPHELSGGQRQRVIIAMSMVLDPELIILDEPTTALDMITQTYIFDILLEIHRTKNLSMILITHDLTAAVKLADKIVVMYGGKVMESGETDDIFRNPLHPYTEGLLGAMPFIDGSVVQKKSIPGSPPDLINRPKGCIFASRCYLVQDICKVDEPALKTNNNRQVACHFRG
ncbi:ABC transporter ATP-binding protein [bacterium]|nr:MAG: ABC transporter ATP-binding protein [bacterium]